MIFHFFKESIKVIARNKFLFVLTLLLPIFFLFITTSFLFTYTPAMISSMQEINDFISSQEWMKIDPTQENLRDLAIPATNPQIIADKRMEMLRQTQFLFFKIGGSYLIFFGLSWLFTYMMAQKLTFKQLCVLYGKLALVMGIYLTLLLSMLYWIIVLATYMIFYLDQSVPYMIIVPLFISAFLIYFMPVSLSLVKETLLVNLIQKTIHVGIRRCLFLFSCYGILLLFLIIAGFLMNLSIEKSLILSSVLGIVMLAVIAITRLVLLTGLSNKSNGQ